MEFSRTGETCIKVCELMSKMNHSARDDIWEVGQGDKSNPRKKIRTRRCRIAKFRCGGSKINTSKYDNNPNGLKTWLFHSECKAEELLLLHSV